MNPIPQVFGRNSSYKMASVDASAHNAAHTPPLPLVPYKKWHTCARSIKVTDSLLPCPTQALEAKCQLGHVLDAFEGGLWYKSLHAALLRPGRLVAWLEAASKLGARDGGRLLQDVAAMVTPESPFPDPPGPAPGMVSAEQWKAGAAQLRLEVRGPVVVPRGCGC
jgi:hypothetical protein